MGMDKSRISMKKYGIHGKMRFPLNNGQANPVKIRPGLGGDTVGLPKPTHGNTGDVQGMYKG
jgi:hypothetical protein